MSEAKSPNVIIDKYRFMGIVMVDIVKIDKDNIKALLLDIPVTPRTRDLREALTRLHQELDGIEYHTGVCCLNYNN